MILVTIILPALMSVACLTRRFRTAAPLLLWIAPLPALAVACLALSGAPPGAPAPLAGPSVAATARGSDATLDRAPGRALGGAFDRTFVIGGERMALVFRLDAPRATLLGAVALLWSFAGAYAAAHLRGDRHAPRFAVGWLLSLTGCLGVFIAGDLASFYLLFALVSLSATMLVIHDDTARARRAAMIYLVLAVLGEAFLLLAFVLLAAGAPGGSLRIDDVVAALPTSPHRTQAILFLLLGFGVKAGLVPLHSWLPIAHPAAPTPASAVLSGAIIKTGVIGLIAFLPLGTSLPDWGAIVVTIGFVTAFTGALLGVTQRDPKTVLAYSSVSQMGVTAAVVGAGLAFGAAAAGMAAAFYALHHVFVKGALFLSVGVIANSSGRWRTIVLVPSLFLALSFAGLPFTGGAIAKDATKPFFAGDASRIVAVLASMASALLMIHFMRRLAAVPQKDDSAPAPPNAWVDVGATAPSVAPRAGFVVPWALTALVAFVAPWALFGPLLGGDPMTTLAPSALWSALWPVLVGGAAALVLTAFAQRLPRVPEGDVIVVAERGAERLRRNGAAVASLEAALGRWTVAGIAFLAVVVLVAVLTMTAPPP